MTRKLTKTLFIVGSMLLVAMGQGYAQKRSLREMLAKWWEHPRIQEKLKLDEAQVQQLNDIFYQYRIQLVDLRSIVEKAQLELEQAMDQENWNENEILQLARQVQEAKNRVELKQLEMALEMRKVLTTQQWKQLQAIRREVRERMMRRRHRRMGPRPESPPQPPHPPRGGRPESGRPGQ